ncbi:hypothetical protein [Streptomyces nitrosporeus]
MGEFKHGGQLLLPDGGGQQVLECVPVAVGGRRIGSTICGTGAATR